MTFLKSNIWIRHLLVWALLMGLPMVIAQQDPNRSHLPWHEWKLLAQIAILFYANYFWLIPRYYFDRRYGILLLWNLALFFLMRWMIVPHSFAPPPPPFERMPPRGTFSFWSKAMRVWFFPFLLNLPTIGVAVAIRVTERLHEDEKKRQVLETEHLRSELSYLKLQVSPHFLFNTLNNIYSLVEISPERARQAVHHLSKLLRYLIYETNSELVPIDHELKFLQSYLELMRLRLPAHIEFNALFPQQTPFGYIAPLLTLPLLENAFKHGVHGEKSGRIEILIELKDEMFICKVMNTSYPKGDEDRSGSGIGLENLRKRLELIYGDTAMYHVEKENDEYLARLTLPIRS